MMEDPEVQAELDAIQRQQVADDIVALLAAVSFAKRVALAVLGGVGISLLVSTF